MSGDRVERAKGAMRGVLRGLSDVALLTAERLSPRRINVGLRRRLCGEGLVVQAS